MVQLLVVVLSYMLIPILIRRKVKLSYTLLITATVLSVFSGIGGGAILGILGSLFTSVSSLNTILVVSMVSMLGGIMKHYGILNRVVEKLQTITGNKKVSMMLIPALIGVLIVPGGAMLSAPFVNTIGEELGILPARRAAINLVFRHVAMFVLPFSTSLLVIGSILPELDIYRIIGLNLVMVAAMLGIGQLLFLREVKVPKVEKAERSGHKLADIKALLLYSSPIYICVLINLIFGVPFYVAMVASLVTAYFLSDKKDFFKVAGKSFNLHIVLTVIAVLVMKDVILHMEDLMGMVNAMFSASGSVVMVFAVIFFTSLLIGYITGYSVASLAITLPLISELGASIGLLHVYTYFAFGCAFIGYFFSPLHLCQAFTLQLMGVTTNELYAQYKLYAPLLLGTLIASVAVMLGFMSVI
ncbi:DUF401 family protein [Acidaminobacter hydrogenoformans]|uniref:DUF401 family protein n=1 Tax=Acidaminobacter hydrogenoformans DSM 2784 TaxID=1120920 RepID=A0A1G5RXS6_9FIRM|nr:DUF401 family protein [Acidaminobacter hydrogenoformans]SCZ78129.1 hypothetical protein SAMN03080599_01088 [Acidaminobacter hydrogenoformans DSM 2784]